MRLWTTFSIFLFIHVLAGAAFLGWLKTSGRLDRDRVDRVVAMFQPTIEQAAVAEAEAASADAAAREQQAQADYIQAVADGPQRVAQQLVQVQEEEELVRQDVERARRMLDDLARQLAKEKAALAAEKAAFEQQRESFEQQVAGRLEKVKDEDFDKAVAMYEQVKPEQAKEMFQVLMATGRQDEVVDYLAVMQPRKSAAVLKKFETDAEIAQATQLVEALRTRGVDLVNQARQPDAERELQR